jgi:threonine dehydrogenase-like Zn-dependent dehydrogenase
VVELGNIVPDGNTVAVDPARDICQRNVRLLGMSFNPPRSYSEAMALLGRHHDIPFARLITGSYTLDHVADALRDISSDGVKVVLTA